MKGPQVMRGYVDSSLDADAFTADGFLLTGDLGRFDEHGAILITGRIKDIIIRKGENVSAKEVEDVLYAHPEDRRRRGARHPRRRPRRDGRGVRRARRSRRPARRSGASSSTAATSGLMTQKIPERLEIIDVMPRNPSGKVPKHELRARISLTPNHASETHTTCGSRTHRRLATRAVSGFRRPARRRGAVGGIVAGGVLGVPLHREEPAAGAVELEASTMPSSARATTRRPSPSRSTA